MSELRMVLALGCSACAAAWANHAAAEENVGATTTTTATTPTETTTPSGTTTTATTTTTTSTAPAEPVATEPAEHEHDNDDDNGGGRSWLFSPFWVIGVDGEYLRTLPGDDDFGDPDGDGIPQELDGENGAAVHARIGYQLNLALLYLRPEVGGGAYFYGDSDDGTDRTEGRVYGGARFGLRTGLSPGVYGHLGYGWYGKDEGTENGFTADAGLLLDLTIIPHLNVGLHGGVVFNPDPVPIWLNGGAHLEITF